MQINIPQRLKDLRQENGFTAKNVAEGINMKIGSYLAYEEGRAIPPLPTVISLCVFYGKTIDELLGTIYSQVKKDMFLDAYYRADPEKRKIVDFILKITV